MRYILFLCLGIVLSAPVCWAHAPADITAQISGETLTVTVSHSVLDPATHYIKRIQAWVNGVQVAQQDFQSQTDASSQVARITVPGGIKGSDVLEIEAFCSRFGSLKKAISLK